MDIRVKNAIKRIAAISTGALMMGTTLMSAVAAAPYTLADYPAPFVSGFTIVVGQDAMPADIIGAVDVGVGLQAAAGRGTAGAPAQTISGESVAVEGPGNPLNLDEPFDEVITAGLDESDLPTILADGEYDDSEGTTDNEEGFTQEINFPAGTSPTLVYDADDDGDKILGAYVQIENSDTFYEYTLEFDANVDFVDDDEDAAEDIENTKLEIQGKPYIVTDFVYDAANNEIDEIELLTGETIITLTQGDSYTFEGHTITVTSVTDDPYDKCGISVDGTSKFIEAGDDEEFDGLRVGVSDVFAIHGAVGEDACEITLGSVLTKLVNGGEVQINGQDIGDREGDPDVTTVVDIDDPAAGEWGGFTITVESDEEINLGSATDGQDWIDPVFGNFKISYMGLSGETEAITFEAASDTATFTFTNNEGKKVEIPMFSADDASLFFGEDSDAYMLIESNEDLGDDIIGLANCNDGNLTGIGLTLVDGTAGAVGAVYGAEGVVGVIQTNGTVDVTALEGTLLFLASQGQTARVVEITEIDLDNDQMSFKDLTYGRTMVDLDEETNGAIDTGDVVDTFDLTGIGSISLNLLEGACDGGEDFAAIELVDGNLANAANSELDENNDAADIVAEGYETDGANYIVPDEEYVDGLGDAAVAVSVLESDDISDTDRSFIITALYYDDGEDEVLIQEPDDETGCNDLQTDFATTGDFQDYSDENDNDRYAMTLAGSLWHIKENDDGNIKDADVKLAVGEARSGAAFVAETGALFTAPTTETTGTAAPVAYTGAVARLDTEITDKTATNMLLIGGPCVNRLTAEVLEKTYPACGIEVATELGVPTDGAQIALFENAFGGTKVAMTVMGVGPDETRAAAEVLKRYNEFKANLKGMKVNVKSTAGVISVSAPAVA